MSDAQNDGAQQADAGESLVAYRGAQAPITTYMSEVIVTVPASATLREAATIIVDASVGCVVVGSADAVEGIITERDIVTAIGRGADPDVATVSDVESRGLVWATSDATVGDVAEEMMEDYVRHVLIGEDGVLAGIVSIRDVISAYTI